MQGVNIWSMKCGRAMQSGYKAVKDITIVLHHELTLYNYKENNNNVK
jgi:hypothetical protein